MISLKKNCLFANLNNDELKKVDAVAEIEKFKKHENIIIKGEPGEKLYIILEGMTKVYRESYGKTKTLAFLKKDDFFGEISLIDKKNRSASILVIEDLLVKTITRKDFSMLLSQNPSIAYKIMGTLCNRFRIANDEIACLVFHDVSGRFVMTILNLARKFGRKISEKIKIELNLTHQDIADIIGTSREVVTRYFKRFKKDGYLTWSGHKLVINNINELKAIVDYKGII